MAFRLGEGFIEFDLDDNKVNSKLSKTARSFEQFTKKMGASFLRLGKITAGVVAVGVALSIKLATKQAKAEAKLGRVLDSTSHAAGFRLDQLKEFASEMQETLAVSDDLIINTMAILGSFVEITGDNFKWATEMVFNLAELMGTDAKSAAVQLGKALNDPIKGLTSLSRSGVSFSESTKQVIKDLVAMGNVAEAQTVILQEMADQGLGGLAEAVGETQPLAKLMNTLGDLMEDFGKPLLKPIEELTEALQKLLDTSTPQQLGSLLAGGISETAATGGDVIDEGVMDAIIKKAIAVGAHPFTQRGSGRSLAERSIGEALRMLTGGNVQARGGSAVARTTATEAAGLSRDEITRLAQEKVFQENLAKFNKALEAAERAMLTAEAVEQARLKRIEDEAALGGARDRMNDLVEDILGGGGKDPRTQLEVDLAAQIKALQDATQSPQNLFQSLDAVADMFSTTSENEQQKQLDVLQQQLKEETEQRKLQARIAEAVENPPPPRLGV